MFLEPNAEMGKIPINKRVGADAGAGAAGKQEAPQRFGIQMPHQCFAQRRCRRRDIFSRFLFALVFVFHRVHLQISVA